MKISLPKQAEDYFSTQADQFLLLLKPEPKKSESVKPPLSSAHRPIDHTFSDEDFIGTTIFGTVDGFGIQKSKYFQTDNGFIGLCESDYKPLNQLIEKLSSRAEIKPYVTAKYIENVIFKWFEEQYKGLIPQSKKFIEYFALESETDIKEYKIGIPISYLAIQEPFTVGKVTFDFYTKEFFDEFESTVKENNPDYDKIDFEEERKKYQGIVFANITVCAEQERCVEIAIEETERALMVLRFISPTTFVPVIPSYFGRMGHANVPVSHYFVFEDKFPIICAHVDERKEFTYKIDSDQLNVLKKTGLELLSQLLLKDSLNELEELFLNSISLFTKGIVSRDFQDKIVFCLVSIETLLLKNSSEPIQHSVGLRLAFISSQSAAERKNVLSIIRDAYELRSSYLHHGKRNEDISILTELQHIIWTGLNNVMINSPKFTNQAQLIEFIENMILT